MGSELDIARDKLYFHAVGLLALSGLERGELPQFSNLKGKKTDARGIHTLASQLGIDFESVDIPADELFKLRTEITRVPILAHVVIQTVADLFGVDEAHALSLLSDMYDSNSGFGWNEILNGFYLLVDGLSLVALAFGIVSPIIGDEMLALSFLSRHTTAPWFKNGLIAFSSAKHGHVFSESSQEFQDLMALFTNTFVSVAHSKIITKMYPNLSNAAVNKIRDALVYEQLDWASIYFAANDGTYKASTAASKLQAIKKAFASQGVHLTNEQVYSLMPQFANALDSLPSVKEADLNLLEQNSLIPEQHRGTRPKGTSTADYWKARAKDRNFKPITNASSLIEFEGKFREIKHEIPPVIRQETEEALNRLYIELSNISMGHPSLWSSSRAEAYKGISEHTQHIQGILDTYKIDLSRLNQELGFK